MPAVIGKGGEGKEKKGEEKKGRIPALRTASGITKAIYLGKCPFHIIGVIHSQKG